MGTSIFYKILATISTVGIVAVAGLLVPIASQKDNDLEESLANTKRELTQARKEALTEVKAMRRDALSEVKAARAESLKALNKAGAKEGSVWLVMMYGAITGGSMEKLEMKDFDQCEEQGAFFKASKRFSPAGYTGFECLEAK